MLTLNRKMDTISNNIANASTNGFKKDTIVFEEFSEVLAKRLFDDTGSSFGNRSSTIGTMSLFNDIAEVHKDFTQGTLESTEATTDVAITGDNSAFFSVAVLGEDGELREYYTRDGSFKLDANGMLVTRDGDPVVGQNGAIYLNGSEFTITSDGRILQNDTLVDTLKITKFTNPETLRNYGYNLFTVTGESQTGEFEGSLQQGFLEGSNVDSVKEMVEMINVLRAYETSQKLIQYQDSTLEKAVNEVGRTG